MPFKPKRKGDTWNGLEIVLDNPNLDFTNCKAKIDFRKGKKNGPLAFQYRLDDNSIIRNGNTFKMIPRNLDYPADKYFFDFEVIFADGKKETFFEDFIIISQDVTK